MEYKKAIAQAEDRYDYLISVYECREFTEIVGSIGGDIERVRVYPDGRVYAK